MRIVGLDHLVIKVSDLEASLSFYGEVLGLEVLRLDEFRKGEVGFPSLRVSDTSIIDLMLTEDSAGGSGNVDHFCLVVEQAKTHDLREQLVARGVAVHGDVSTRWGARGNGEAFTISDPDGNKIELKSYGK